MIEFDNTIPDRCLQSPALISQDKIHYPKKYAGKVPMKIRMLKTVTSDLPIMIMEAGDELFIAVKGNQYYCRVNSLGAITALLSEGVELGMKSTEFEVIEWHNVIK